MFDWVPLKYYSYIYYSVLAIFLIAVLMVRISHSTQRNHSVYNYTAKVLSYILIIFSTIYLGMRPISIQFVDMVEYENIFNYLKSLSQFSLSLEGDGLFWYYVYAISKFYDAHTFFLITELLYILPLYWVSKHNFKKLWFFSFFCFISAFSFFSYGTNGIRNGLATSVFLLVFATNKKYWRLLWLVLSYFIHGSMLIPIIAFIGASLYRNNRHLLIFWLFCIPVSLAFGTSIQKFLAMLIADERTGYLNADTTSDYAYLTSFRWDFIVYSASAIGIGWYTKRRYQVSDNLYQTIFGTYVIANAVWILVINASFSNRFAYLSWFLMPLVVIYPALQHYQVTKKDNMVIWVTVFYFFFTLSMTLLYSLR